MISLKNASQIAKMREAGKILREVEDEVRLAVKPGVTTAELDVLAERLIRKHRAIPSSLHYEGYPCSICASLNDEVVHGIPSDRRVLKEGDILSASGKPHASAWQGTGWATWATRFRSMPKRTGLHRSASSPATASDGKCTKIRPYTTTVSRAGA